MLSRAVCRFHSAGAGPARLPALRSALGSSSCMKLHACTASVVHHSNLVSVVPRAYAASSVATRAFSTFPPPKKTTTGLVGVPVILNARDVLMALLKKALEKLQELPSDIDYTLRLNALFKYQLSVCENAKSHEEIEKTLNMGQMEEVIAMIESELMVIDFMKAERPWEADWTKIPVVLSDPDVLTDEAQKELKEINPEVFDQFFKEEDVDKMNYVVGNPLELFDFDDDDNITLRKKPLPKTT